MVKVHLDTTHSVGLGDNICLLSALAKVPDQVDLYTTNAHGTFDKLSHYKKIFNIPDSSLRILSSDTNGSFNNTGWPLKLFTEYYQPESVVIRGKECPIKHTKPKQCIAIAGFFEAIPADATNNWPGCKQRPLEYWARIFLWLKSMDYEVVTVDRHFFELEDKVDLLVNQCDAIISYEGGMAHLSHMLRIPCFLIDWKLPSPSTVLGNFHCEFVHRTKNVYIVRNDEEFFGWDRTAFNLKVNDLKQGISNNRLVNGECNLAFAGPTISSSIVVTQDSKELLTVPGFFGVHSVAGQFLSQYYNKF
jgi:hypothetical protein